MTRFPAIAPENMTEAQKTVAAEIAAGPRGEVRGPFVALLHNPVLAGRLQALGEYLRFNTKLDRQLTEIAVLVTARHWTCQYEWFAHERIARAAGLKPAIIDAIAAGHRPEGMSTDEALVHDVCLQALEKGSPEDALYEAAVARFGRDGILDLLALPGYYSLLAMVLNTARPVLPNGVADPLQPLA